MIDYLADMGANMCYHDNYENDDDNDKLSNFILFAAKINVINQLL